MAHMAITPIACSRWARRVGVGDQPKHSRRPPRSTPHGGPALSCNAVDAAALRTGKGVAVDAAAAAVAAAAVAAAVTALAKVSVAAIAPELPLLAAAARATLAPLSPAAGLPSAGSASLRTTATAAARARVQLPLAQRGSSTRHILPATTPTKGCSARLSVHRCCAGGSDAVGLHQRHRHWGDDASCVGRRRRAARRTPELPPPCRHARRRCCCCCVCSPITAVYGRSWRPRVGRPPRWRAGGGAQRPDALRLAPRDCGDCSCGGGTCALTSHSPTRRSRPLPLSQLTGPNSSHKLNQPGCRSARGFNTFIQS